MPRNGSGTFTVYTPGNPVVTGAVISSTAFNATMTDFATGLTNSIAKDGQTTPTANLPMGTYKHTGVGAGAATTDYARYDQVQNSSPQWLTSVSGTDTITASATVAPSAYAAGQTFRFVSAGANTTTTPTLNVNSLGAKTITKNGTAALAAGDIPSGAVVEVTYDGTYFQLINVKNQGGSGSITSSGYTQNTAKMLGRTTASSGAIEEISVGTGLTLSAGSLTANSAGITLATMQASTSGTSIDFTSIPAGTKRIVINFVGVSTSGTSNPLIQLGKSGGPETSGYLGAGSDLTTGANFTTGFGIPSGLAANVLHGTVVLSLVDAASNTWAAFGILAQSNSTTVNQVAGSKSLAGTLDRVRITTVGGSDTFDAGNINIQYE